MSEKLNVIEAKYAELTDVLKKQNDFLNQTTIAIKQLRAERKRALAQVNETNGALQAYGSTINLLKEGQPEVVAETPAVNDPAPALEGEVVTQ